MGSLPLQAFVRGLLTTPPELTHQIIDDLRVWDILRLLIHDNPHINGCILSHQTCGQVFNHDPEILAQVRDAARFYHEFCSSCQLQMAPENSILALNIRSIKAQRYNKILDTIHSRIYNEIQSATKIANLNRYATVHTPDPGLSEVWDYSTIEALEKRWKATKEARKNLAHKSISQLHWAADMLQANPGILKKTLDPGQQPRRNITHVVQRMKASADKCKKVHRLYYAGSEFLLYEFFPIIPFDWALEELIDMLVKHQLATKSPGGEDGVPEKKPEDGLSHPIEHPTSIKRSAQILIIGMPYFYSSFPQSLPQAKHPLITNNQNQVFRTANTPWSGKPFIFPDLNLETPCFTPHNSGVRAAFRRDEQFRLYEPHDGREEEWLEAFVSLYRYFKALENEA
ncbi:hypothetical protein N7474_002797 [Penicillium riverlandense]|uniref:uncharacterized protein n=1 Tax=Penicillium riverlandense TaxID=1903569 RepID=UPI0025482A2F|nr:uncharacterized protein N7474_002797 [Penicillium riverlandense]KAJ5825659.1 hypothetical protein N7474_002797 [Penicillium riverlandense]